MNDDYQDSKTKNYSDDDILKELSNAIIENRLSPGVRLGQDELGRIFGVSKTRIRPILRQLAQRKIVVIKQKRGAFVAKPSIEDTKNVNKARQIIEEGIVRTVTKTINDKQISYLKRIIKAEEKARFEHNLGYAHHLTGKFHIALAEITGTMVIVNILEELISRDSLAVALYQKPIVAGCSIEEHNEILDRICSKNEEYAVQAMKEHLENIINSLDLREDERKNLGVSEAFMDLLE